MLRLSQKQQHSWEHQWEVWEQHYQQCQPRTWIQWLRDHQECWESRWCLINYSCNEQCAAQWGTPCHWWCALNLCCCSCPSGSETGVFCSPQTGVLHSEFHPWHYLGHKHWLAAVSECSNIRKLYKVLTAVWPLLLRDEDCLDCLFESFISVISLSTPLMVT